MVSYYTLAILLLAWLTINHTVNATHNHLVEHIDRISKHIEGVIAMSNQDTINAVVTQLGKAKAELIGKLTDLQAQIDAGVPAEQLDLTALTEAAQALDDIVPDPAVEEPAADEPVDSPPF